MIPEIKDVKVPSLTLPTAWQTVIFRNYGYVRNERIARVLECDEDTVEREAKRLGLVDRGYQSDFETRGYITIIRNNWYLLPYDQLMTLLGFDEERLDFALEKDDFLNVKLGGFKPRCERVTFSQLDEKDLAKTKEISNKTLQYTSISPKAKPFDFFTRGIAYTKNAHVAEGKRIVHGYLSPCGDVFVTDCSDTLPDELLAQYKAVGINGIWLHGVLSTLSPYPFAPRLAEGYEKRRKNLNKIIDRCAKYGISVYLYMNEPRALPVDCLPEYEHLIGWQAHRTLCMDKPEVREYLYEAVRDLCSSAKKLGGIFTITMSENATHCHYKRGTTCPICSQQSPENSAATVNNIMYRAMKNSGCGGELITNLWGWSPFSGWSEKQTADGIRALEKDIPIVCVSEYDLEIEKGGVHSRVIDYYISNPGPSEITKHSFDVAAADGRKSIAKIQASNSWECSAVPYIPVFDLVFEHLENLSALGVKDYFLTWTLGGYPSPSVELASGYRAGFSLEKWYRDKFGNDAEAVHYAIKELCSAFRELPFSLSMLYNSPKNIGPANLWEIEPEEKRSTMVCYSYDDIETWIKPYPYEVYVSQLEKLLAGWDRGIEALAKLTGNDAVAEIVRYAEVLRCHYTTDLLHTRFAYAKRQGDVATMLECTSAERENAERLLHLMKQDARIGFEASNHYSYTEINLIEKIIRMDSFSKKLRR